MQTLFKIVLNAIRFYNNSGHLGYIAIPRKLSHKKLYLGEILNNDRNEPVEYKDDFPRRRKSMCEELRLEQRLNPVYCVRWKRVRGLNCEAKDTEEIM